MEGEMNKRQTDGRRDEQKQKNLALNNSLKLSKDTKKIIFDLNNYEKKLNLSMMDMFTIQL